MYGCVTYNKCGHTLKCIPNCALVRTSIECGVRSVTLFMVLVVFSLQTCFAMETFTTARMIR